MTAKSFQRGHPIYFDGKEWRYAETGESAAEGSYTPDLVSSGQYGKCASCGLPPTAEGHDGCLGTLPKCVVMNACCGHGREEQAYVQWWTGESIRGAQALAYIEANRAISPYDQKLQDVGGT